MARSVSTIYNQLLAQKNAQAALNSLNSTSQVSKWNLILWINAFTQALFEQEDDKMVGDLEAQIVSAPVFIPQWLVKMCKLFQYSAIDPQVLYVIESDTPPYVTAAYPVVNSSLCPVSQAAIVPTSNKQLQIKVATGTPPGPLDGAPGITGPICTALISYLKILLTPDTHFLLVNLNADQLLIKAQIFYDASYSGVIKANMDAAISNYLANIPFNGVVTVSDLEETMLNVSGVNDVMLEKVYWRKDTDPIPPAVGNILVDAYTLVNRNYQTFAGYVITEQTPAYTIDDLITYTPS